MYMRVNPLEVYKLEEYYMPEHSTAGSHWDNEHRSHLMGHVCSLHSKDARIMSQKTCAYFVLVLWSINCSLKEDLARYWLSTSKWNLMQQNAVDEGLMQRKKVNLIVHSRIISFPGLSINFLNTSFIASVAASSWHWLAKHSPPNSTGPRNHI